MEKIPLNPSFPINDLTYDPKTSMVYYSGPGLIQTPHEVHPINPENQIWASDTSPNILLDVEETKLQTEEEFKPQNIKSPKFVRRSSLSKIDSSALSIQDLLPKPLETQAKPQEPQPKPVDLQPKSQETQPKPNEPQPNRTTLSQRLFLPIRFSALANNSRLTISASGLTVTANNSDEELAVTNLGFSQGVHYWEIICPISCDNISVGVIKEGWNPAKPLSQNSSLASFWQFRTSTPRVIGVKLDFSTMEVRCWLNGNFQPQRIIKITEGVWFPCIKIREKGNQLILNPFGLEPSKNDSITNEDYGIFMRKIEKKWLSLLTFKEDFLRKNLKKWLFLTEFTKMIKTLEELKAETELVIDFQIKLIHNDEFLAIYSENSEVLYEALKKKQEGIKRIEFEEIYKNLNIICLDPNNKLNQSKFTDFIKVAWIPQSSFWLEGIFLEFLKEHVDVPIDKTYNEALEALYNPSPKEKLLKKDVVSEVHMEMLSSDNMLLINGNKLKLLRRTQTEGFEILPNIFRDRIKGLDYDITLSISKEDAIFLLKEFPWNELFLVEGDNNRTVFLIKDLFEAIAKGEFIRKNTAILLTMHLKQMKMLLDSLISFIQGNIQRNRSLFKENSTIMTVSENNQKEKLEKQFKEDDKALPFAEGEPQLDENNKKIVVVADNKAIIIPAAEDEKHKFFIKNACIKLISLELSQNLLAILMGLDSQIFTALQHNDNQGLDRLLYPESVSRSHLAISRLASFINYSNNGNFKSIELAEAGLTNVSDHFQDLRHFLDFNKLLENFQNLRISDNKDLWRILQNMLPHNRMLQGLKTFNVTLHESIRDMPYQLHDLVSLQNSEGKLPTEIAVKTCERPYFAGFSEDGTMSLWNTELFLIKLLEINFRVTHKTEKKVGILDENNPPEEDLLSGYQLFDENFLKPPVNLKELKKEELQPAKQPAPPKEPDVIPDPGMIEALYNMGFPVDLAKKALIKVKNADLSIALDTILVIQEEESKNPNKTASFKSNMTLLKPKWQCHACTYMNMNSANKNCVICGTQAPIDAYYTEEELNREEDAQKKLKAEQEKLNVTAATENNQAVITEEKKEEIKPPEIPVISEEEKQKNELAAFRKDIITKGIITSPFLIESKNSKAAGFLAGIAFNLESPLGFSVIRLRRLGMRLLYIMSFVSPTKTDHGFINNITREWVRDENYQAIEENLFEEGSRFSLEVLDPMYNAKPVRISANKGNNDEKSNWDILYEYDIEIPLSYIHDINWVRKGVDEKDNEEFSLLILGRTLDGKEKIIVKNIVMVNGNPYEKPDSILLNNNNIKEIEIKEIKDSSAMKLEKAGQMILLIANNQVIFINTENMELEPQRTLKLDFPIKKTRFFNNTLIFISKNHEKLHSIEIKAPVAHTNGENPPSKSQPEALESHNTLDPLSLSVEEIKSLRSLLNVESLGSFNENSHKSHYDNNNNLYTKHHWLINETEKSLELRLKKPENLVNFILDLHLENKTSNTYKTLHELLHKEKDLISTIRNETNQRSLTTKLQKPKLSIDNTIKKPLVNILPNFSMTPENLNENFEESSVELAKNSNKTGFSEANYLPLRVKHFEGAAYNNNIFVSKLLVPNKEIFITNYYNAYFVLEHLQESLMIVDTVTIQSDFGVVNGGFPLGSGLIFLSNSLSNFYINPIFQNMTPGQYKEYSKNRASEPFEFEPVAAFQFDEKSETLVIDLDYKRPCKYIMIKPTNMRITPKDFSANFKSSPIEVRFIGVQGATLDKNVGLETIQRYYQEIPQNVMRRAAGNLEISHSYIEMLKKGELILEVLEDGKTEWNVLDANALEIVGREFIQFEENLRFPEEIDKPKWKLYSDKGVPLSGRVSLEIMEKSLKNKRISALRLKLNKISNKADWSMKAISLELMIPKHSNLRIEKHHNLRYWLIDLDFYNKFNRELVRQLGIEKFGLERKKAIMVLLTDLMELKGKELVELIYKDLDLLEFLKQNVLKERFSNTESCNFLRFFTSIPRFSSDLLSVLFKILTIFLSIEVTPLGLKSFFGLLSWCHHLDYETSFFELLGCLQSITKRIRLTRSPNYNLLRVQYNIGSLAFEKELFSNENLSFRKKIDDKKLKMKVATGGQISKKTPIKAKILIRKMSFGRKFLIDLGHEHHLEEMGLALERSDQTNVKLLVKVWMVDPITGKKLLIHNDFYRESTYIQLSNYAYLDEINKQAFKKEEKLNSIGFSQFHHATRYLIVQITHSFMPSIKLSNEQTANNNIIPEVWGSLNLSAKNVNNKKYQNYQEMLNQKPEELKVLPLNLNNLSSEGQYFEIKDKKDLFLFDSTNVLKKNETAVVTISLNNNETIEGGSSVLENELRKEYYKNEEILYNDIMNLQSELSSKLFQYRSLNVSNPERQEIQDLCENIEENQLQLLSLKQNRPNFEGNSSSSEVNSSNASLDFLYNLVLKLSVFLRKIDISSIQSKMAKSWRQNDWIQQEKGKIIALDLFETLVIYESSSLEVPINSNISQEIIKLLTEVLIDNLNEREWQHFIIIILKKFLSQPVSLGNSPIDRIFSHNKLIQALDQISIPNGEILAYLAYRLCIQYDGNTGKLEILRPPLLISIPVEERKQQETSLLCTIVSILILLHKGFQKIPFEAVDSKKIVHKGSYCFNCGQSKFITGTRLKCLNCPNVDCCSNGTCENKHLLLYPNHVFIHIEEPLPLAPNKRNQPEPIALAPTFTFVDPATDSHGVNCETCNKEIVGIRMMCANCEDFSLCKACYEVKNHTKYHVFVKIDNKIQPLVNSTPKCLIQMLDPLLYPLKATVTEGELSPLKKKLSKGVSREVDVLKEGAKLNDNDEEIKVIGLKKSVSSPARDEEYLKFTKKTHGHTGNSETGGYLNPVPEDDENFLTMPRFDYEDCLKISMQVCVWICETSAYNDSDRINVLSLCFDLIQEILKLSSMAGIKDFLSNSTYFLKIFLNVLKLGSSPLLSKFNNLLESLATPKNAPKTDEAYLSTLSSYEKQRNLAEKFALDELRILLVYHLQTVLHWVLDYALNPSTITMYSQIFKESLTASLWLEQISFVLELFLNSSEKLSKLGFYKKRESAANVPGGKPPKRQQSSLIQEEPSTQVISQPPLTNQPEVLLLPPGILRAMSLPHDNQSQMPIKTPIVEQKSILELEPKAGEKYSSVSLSTSINLIDLLFPHSERNTNARQGYNFAQSAKLWSLVFKAILKVKMSVLSENNVFDSLIHAFLLANEEIQHTMFQEILHLTQNMMNQGAYQKEFSNSILSILFKFIRENMSETSSLSSFSSISFNLLKGWLDILLTKSTPKPEEYYTKSFDKAFCKLNPQGVLQLLNNVSYFLVTHVNYGGKEGIQLATETDIMKMNLADDMMKLLIFSESQNTIFAISELFHMNNPALLPEIRLSMKRIIDWYLLNQSKETLISPSTDLMLSISTSALKLFALAGENEDIAKLCIKELISSCKSLDDLLIRKFRSSQLSNYMSLILNEQNCRILEELLDLWVINDSIASYVAFEVKGFEFLLDRMGVVDNSGASIEEDPNNVISSDGNKTSLLSGTDLLDYIQQGFGNNVDKTSSIPTAPSLNKLIEGQKKPVGKDEKGQLIKAIDLKEEEFANKIYIVNQAGQHWSGIGPDWSLNKKGIRARILFFQMSNQFYSEYSLMLELDRVCEMKQIKIGFNTVWTDYNDKVLGVPSSILLEGGLNKNALIPLGTLDLINDEGYSNYSVKVFKKNFQTLNIHNLKESTLENWLKSLNNKQVKVIRLTFRRPIVTFVENLSMLSNKTYKNICVAISFLSISGYDVSKLPSYIGNSLLETQKNSALQVLGKLCNSQYNETLNTLANRVDVIQKIKASFDFLSNLLVMHDNWLSPVFLAIAHNQETGDFIINKFLDIEKAAPHAKMILEIILSNPHNAFPRVLKLFAFIKERFVTQKKNPNTVQNLSTILHFIDTFTSGLRLLTNDIPPHENKAYIIPCTHEDLELLIMAYELNYTNQNISKSLIKLLISLLYVTEPFSLQEPGLIPTTLDYVYMMMKKTSKIAFYELLAQLVAGFQHASRWFLNNDAERLEDLLNILFQHLEELEKGTIDTQKLSKAILQILNGAVSLDDNLKQYILKKETHLTIYHKMKQSQGNSILKISEPETLSLLVDFIKNVALGYGKREEKLAEALKEDLSLLETRRDMQYVTQFLIPLLNAEINVPICLHAYDSHAKKWIIEGRKMTKIQKTLPQSTNESFNPKAFNQFQRDSFDAILKQMTTPSGLYQKISKGASWELAVTQDSDAKVGIGEQILQKVLKNAPFIMVLEGTNSGKNCITGIFSSQSITDNPVEDYSYEKIYNINSGTDNFLFYYDEECCMHFNIPQYPGQNYLGHYHVFEDGGSGLSFHYNGQERIFVSYQAGTTTYVDINLYDMKPIDENSKGFPGDIPADFQFRKCEFWILKQQASNVVQGVSNKSSDSLSANIGNVLFAPWYNQNNPLNLYRSSPVYGVPASISIDKLCQCFFGSSLQLRSHISKETLKNETILSDLWEFVAENPQTNRILDIDFDIYELFEKPKLEEKNKKQGVDDKNQVAYMPNMSIFEAFERCGGVNKIIEVILKSLSLWKNKSRAKNWHAWVNELHSFSNLPHFFGLLMKNKECIELLFQLLKGTPDEEAGPEKPDKKPLTTEQKKWEEEEQKAVKFSYKILSDVFKVDNNAEIRDFALEKHLIDRFLDRIALISKENGRKYVDEIPEVKEEEQKVEKKKEEDDGKKKIVKKKGIGYASDNTGQNQKWNISEYHESKKNQSEQLQSLLGILETFLDFNDWKPPKKFYDIVCTSALLPLIEAAFRSGSLLDMSKDADLFICFLRITKLFSKHHSLIPLLLDLDPHYVPKQTESIFFLLANLKELASIFKACMTADAPSATETATTDKLANEILTSYEIIEKAISEYHELENEGAEEGQLTDILALPIPEAYRTLLKDLRFDYTNMKDTTGNYKHHYASYIGKGPYTPPQTKIVRLAQELADLSTALPIEYTNSIFVRCDQSRVDVMKALIMGASGTPYGHGAYEYDIYFDDNYPAGPPKVNLETTGAGRVRFNPNLYSCGKVCLSLLGTWRGNATENWDPKLSTLLQVVVSLQAIIMSEEVYFNEPGYEGEAGTEEGERKNEAYCNIVRYCNIKFAMVDQMRNPSKGFETVIRRHFYLKRQEIMEECQKWLKYAQVRETSYTGLINDHNSSWCNQFKKSKDSYYIMLKEAVKELEDEFNKLPVPSMKDVKTKKLVFKKKGVKKDKPIALDNTQGIMNLEEVDVSYEKQVLQKVLDISDEKVKDRWSRYIGAMGIEAVAKQANSSVFLSGLGPLGVEIAKNVVLSGVKRFTLHDSIDAGYSDLVGQFFLGEVDIGKNRAVACIEKIQQLNNYVKVDMSNSLKKLPKDEEGLLKVGLKDYTLVVMCDSDYETQIAVDNFCRKHKIFFVSCDTTGPFGRVFLDLGEKFDVLDKNGEELQEMMIKNIENAEEAKVELLQGSKHNLEDGDLILITGVEGMNLKPNHNHPESNQTIIKQELLKNSINGSVHKVKVINKSSFYIGDTRNYEVYIRNGLAKPIKSPVLLEFQSLENVLKDKKPAFDAILAQHDFMKLNNQLNLHIAYQVLQEFRKTAEIDMPKPWEIDSLEAFVKLADGVIKNYEENPEEIEKIKTFLGKFSLTCAGQFGPLSAFLGGFVSQEVIKAITQKYMPIKQLFYTDCIEIIPDLPSDVKSWKDHIKALINAKEFEIEKNRYDGLKVCIGSTLLKKLIDAKIFMVGAGAIGCELLKNYAMLSIGTGKTGLITLTDPDVIETSNLNRQFLFREKHLRKPKSSTAAASALQMNPLLKGHINARLDKVHEGTANIFTDKFFEEQTIVTNALDNVQARRYIDMRCVNSKIPLIESGTLGPKGHVQVVIPYKTESYGSQEDPVEENEIPHCTLKMFPEETLHCVEWARDKFGKLFFQRPKNLLKILEDLENYVPTSSQELKNLREAVTYLKKRPLNFDDCVIYARKKFQKYFINDIRQLLHTYPLDHKTKEGNPFWTLPKRPPVELNFDEKDQLFAGFISAFACLRAVVFNIPIPKESRSEIVKKGLAETAGKVPVVDFKPSEEKAKAILSQVEEKPKATGVEEVKEESAPTLLDDYKKYVSEIVAIIKDFDKKNLKAEEFEKDNDENYHIDFIYALANCRAKNYKLDPMDWVTVKIKAGRIIPALATTTAAIAGLQTIELVKLLKTCKLDDMKNAFLNLAVPSLQLSEPGPPPTIKLTENLKVNLWDRWEIKGNKDTDLKGLFEELKKTYDLWPKDVMSGSQAVYFSAIYNMPGKEKDKEEMMGKKLVDLLGIEDEKYINLTVTFAKDEKGEILKGTPLVRMYFE